MYHLILDSDLFFKLILVLLNSLIRYFFIVLKIFQRWWYWTIPVQIPSIGMGMPAGNGLIEVAL